ncbi:MAG TPA: protein kinase, partial [Polyangiaceae bacterium]
PLYMSPEQMRSSRDADARSDIWAIGVILQELVTGQVPFEGESMPELCARVLAEPPRLVRQVRPDLPAQFEAVVARCLEKDPDKRFPHVAALAEALAPFGGQRAYISVERISTVLTASMLGGIAPSLPAASQPASAQTAFGHETTAEKKKRALVPWVFGGAAVFALLLTGIVMIAMRRAPNHAPTTAENAPGAQPAAPPLVTAPQSLVKAKPTEPQIAPMPAPAPAAPSVSAAPSGSVASEAPKTVTPKAKARAPKPKANSNAANDDLYGSRR